MTSGDLKRTLAKPEIERLKDMGAQLRIDHVIGTRVLVKKVKPYTDIDRLEASGLLYAPDDAKRVNTPMETCGIVVSLGSTALNDPMNRDADGNAIIVEGSMVSFSKFAGTDITADNEDFRIIELREILCTFAAKEGNLGDNIIPVKDEETRAVP